MFELRSATAIASIVLLFESGCASYLGDNKARDADSEVPDTWGTPAGAPVPSPGAPTTTAAQQTFDEFFTDPHLRALIEEALDNNQELNIRLQEIIIAQAQIGGFKGQYLPFVGAYVDGGIEKTSTYSSQGAADDANGVPANLPYLGFGLTASWEIDIWSKLRNAAKSANNRYMASIEAKNFLLTQIIAEIASSYYELLALDRQIDTLERYIALQQDGLEAVKIKKAAARATELAVQRFEAEILKNQARRFDLEQQRIEAENRINFLLARYPQPVARDASNFVETDPPLVGVGLSSDLLDNRPDVRQAELMLEAAKLDTKVAKAAFYPSLTIDAGIGYQSFNPAHLLDTPASLVYNLGGSLLAPLLNRKAIKADYIAANAMQMQAVFEFEQTLLQAFTEVFNYLAMVENLRNRYEQQRAQVDTLHAAIDTSNVLYQSAQADYVEVLLTRRDALEAEMELIETRKRQMLAMVGIYRALGGGWLDQEPEPPPPKKDKKDKKQDKQDQKVQNGQQG